MLSQVEFLIAAIDGPPLALLDPVALDSPRILPQLPNCGGAHPVHGVEFNDPSKIHSLEAAVNLLVLLKKNLPDKCGEASGWSFEKAHSGIL